jgi:hypothetical protein
MVLALLLPEHPAVPDRLIRHVAVTGDEDDRHLYSIDADPQYIYSLWSAIHHRCLESQTFWREASTSAQEPCSGTRPNLVFMLGARV